jgi:hypothetical protein
MMSEMACAAPQQGLRTANLAGLEARLDEKLAGLANLIDDTAAVAQEDTRAEHSRLDARCVERCAECRVVTTKRMDKHMAELRDKHASTLVTAPVLTEFTARLAELERAVAAVSTADLATQVAALGTGDLDAGDKISGLWTAEGRHTGSDDVVAESFMLWSDGDS